MASSVVSCYVVLFVLVIMTSRSMANFEKDHNFRSKRSFDIAKFDLPREGRTCHDLCNYMSHMCRNGGTCVTDQSTCEGKCVCSPGWSGRWCKDQVSAEDVSDGNTKLLADELEQNMSSILSTKIFHQTKVSGDDGIKEAKSRITFATRISNGIKPTNFKSDLTTKRSLNATLTSSDDSEGRTLCQNTCQNGDCYNIYGEYKCKPRVDVSDSSASKVCAPGFKCDHGICDLVALRNNSYDCICERNYVGQFCDHRCHLDCGEHGFCDLHVPDNTNKCFCQWNYTGLNCSEPVPLDDEIQINVVFHWYVVGVSIATVTVVLASMFLGAYFMWRRRLVFMLKIVHYFQQYEDDDGKEFDAFISYKSTPEDEAFVLQQLYPRLETQLNFKLCLHFRDFIPGEAIANNIVKAIESSRRTIMILSPAYVKSEWCRMEYQKAQHEMLKLKHKIIPVVLENVSDLANIDKNLKTILSSVTYIEWPGSGDTKRFDKFWKKLELSMPKRSNTSSSESSPDQVCTRSSSLSPSDIVTLTDEQSGVGPKYISSSRRSSSSRVQKSRKRDFKRFMDKLVVSKLFNRQDSTSSQAALVDEETVTSRSSCDSVSESVFTESSDSACSTPITAHTYLSEVDENQESNIFFSACSRRVSHSKENLLQLCEKDHCEDSNCDSCLKLQNGEFMGIPNGEFVNRGFISDEDVLNSSGCRYCKRSDYNRIKISALDSDRINIKKLLVDTDRCTYCRHPLNRYVPYRGSMKERKDATNNKLQKRNRVSSLPRNYKRTAELARREITLDIDSLETEVGDSLGHFYVDVCENV